MTLSRSSPFHALSPLQRIVCVAILVFIGLLAFSAAQASAASLYWNENGSVGSQQIDDATRVLTGSVSIVTNSESCRGDYSWSANSTTYFAANGKNICMGPLDGSGPVSTLVATGCNVWDQAAVGGIYATDQYVYYACHDGTRIGRVSTGGLDHRPEFATAGGESMNFSRALTGDANWLYVSVQESWMGSGRIRRYPIDGGQIDPASSFVVPSLGHFHGVAVDGQHIYWANPKGAIGRVDLDGKSNKYSSWISVGAGTPWGIAVTGSSVYWATKNPGSIGYAALNAGGATSGAITGLTMSGEKHDIAIVGGTAKTPLGAALTNSAVPAITGTVDVGQTLTADAGTWLATPDNVYYQWENSSDSGTTWTIASGKGVQTTQYTVAVADMTKQLRVRVRAGQVGALLTTVYSNPTTAVPLPPAPTVDAAPVISGLVKGAQVVTATAGSWSNPGGTSLTYAYQWQMSPSGHDGSWTNSTNPGNATVTYLILLADATQYLRLCVTASNGATTTACASSAVIATELYPTRIFTQAGWSTLNDGSARVNYWHAAPGYLGFSSNGTTNYWAGAYTAPADGTANGRTTIDYGSFKAILIDGQYLYRNNPAGATIMRSKSDGSELNTEFVNFVDGAERNHLASDRNYLYFRSSRGIGRAPITGGSAQNDFVRGASLNESSGIAVDSDHIYWANDTCIGRADITGTGIDNCWVSTNFGYGSGKNTIHGLGVDRDALYFWVSPSLTNTSGTRGIARVNLDGTGLVRLALISDDGNSISVVQDAGAAGLLPVKLTVPMISGTGLAGSTVSATVGSWTNTPESYTYHWLVSNDGLTGWSVAAGVTGTTASYAIPESYAGKYLQARVIAHNGSTWSDAAYTDAVWVPAPPVNTAISAVTGTVKVGESLSAGSGTWSYPPADASGFAYLWQVSATGTGDWTTAAGTDSATAGYVPVAAEYGKFLRVRVTATNVAGPTVAFSVASSVVLPVAPVSSDAPVVTGTAQVDVTLSAGTGTWTSQQQPTGYVYLWQVSDDGSTGWATAAGTGSATATYVPVAAEYAKFLRVKVTATNTGGSKDAFSVVTGVVLPVAPVSSVVPVVTGTVQVGETLSVDTGSWTSQQAPTTYVYEWQVSANGQDGWTAALGEGGDSAEYDVDLTDDNKYLRVKVTATNDGGSTDVYSVVTSLVDILAPTSSAVPQISGTVELGRTLTASTGTWDFATDYAYAWQSSADGSTWEAAPGSGAATSSYTVAAADAGRYLRVRVTGSNRNGSLATPSASSTRVPSPASSVVVTPPAETPAPVFSPAPGITVGEKRGEAVLTAAVPAAGADLLRGANIWVRPSSKVEYVASALPAGLKLVNGKLVATKPGTYQVTIKVKSEKGIIRMRTIKIKVG